VEAVDRNGRARALGAHGIQLRQRERRGRDGARGERIDPERRGQDGSRPDEVHAIEQVG